ncbi:MAG: hypothetical protein NTW75_12080 [Planctomycetales bacterium]|nr:hypothetical protein [Planctomycetales bacterium]
MAWRITIFSFQAKHKRPSAQPEAERKNKKLGRPPHSGFDAVVHAAFLISLVLVGDARFGR